MNFQDLGEAPRADLHMKPPSTMGHESLIQRRQSLSHPGGLKYFFSDIQSVTLNYHTPRHIQFIENVDTTSTFTLKRCICKLLLESSKDEKELYPM